MMNYRQLFPSDQETIWEMLTHAAHEPDLSHIKAVSALARYAQAWGRSGDCGYGCFENGNAVGAAWIRLFSEEDPGYGFVSNQIPELAIAILPGYRSQGLGTQLLDKLLATVNQSHPGISLSVRSDNPAIALYERFGFQCIENSEETNRTGGTSYTMVKYFES